MAILVSWSMRAHARGEQRVAACSVASLIIAVTNLTGAADRRRDSDRLGREPYPLTHRGPRADAFARAGKSIMKNGSDGGALATLWATAWAMWRRDVRPPSDSRNSKEKARAGCLRAGFTIFAMVALCP